MSCLAPGTVKLFWEFHSGHIATRSQSYHETPADKRRWASVDLMLGKRRTWWPSIKSTLDQRLVLTGTAKQIRPLCFSSVLDEKKANGGGRKKTFKKKKH